MSLVDDRITGIYRDADIGGLAVLYSYIDSAWTHLYESRNVLFGTGKINGCR